MKIFIVEDDVSSRVYLERALRSQGYSVESAANGLKALEKLEQSPPDLIISDIMMPEMDGFELCRRVKTDERLRIIPFVFYTATFIEQKDEKLAMTLGASRFLIKPLELDDLFRAIKGVIDEHQGRGLGVPLQPLAEMNDLDRMQLEVLARKLDKKVRELEEEREASKRSENKYRKLLESMMDGFVYVGMDGMIRECNVTYKKMLGYAEEDLNLAYTNITPEKWHGLEQKIMQEQVLARGFSDIYEKEYRRKDGTIFPVELHTFLIRNEQGENEGMWVIVRDITARKRSEEKLRASEAKYRSLSQQFNALLDSMPDGIVHIAPDFMVLWANRSMTEQVNADEVLLIGNRCYESFWGFREPCLSCPVARSFQSGEFEEGNMSMPDGRILELRAVPISDESGKVESAIEVIRDITEHRKLEEQLRQAQKMESIGTLAGGISHDFNNILTAIIGFGHLALMKMGPDDPQRENVENMLEGGDRAAQLTKDLLIFSRKQVSEKRQVDLNEIIRKVEKFLVRVIGEDIKCSMALYSEPIVVYADPHQLEQVLMNLATNARDAMTEGGDLMISTDLISLGDNFVAVHGYGKAGRHALMTLSDTGKGMDEETKQKIFDPFFTTKEIGKGTGLGLAVVYGIIKQHDGYINVYSEPGSGTTFRIYLPLISSEVQGEEIAQVEETLARGTETILLAEDDESVRNLIGIVLKQEGYTVIEAVDGEDAVKKFIENREAIRLFVSDLIMPKMDGKAAYDEMKVWRPGLKAIFVSGYAPDLIRQKLCPESDVALISKPVLPHALLRKVRILLDEVEK